MSMMYSDAAHAWHLLGFTEASVKLTELDHVRAGVSTTRRAIPLFVVVAGAVVLRTMLASNMSTWPEMGSFGALLWLASVYAFTLLQCHVFLWTMESALLTLLPRLSSSCDVLMMKEVLYLSLYPVWIALIVSVAPFGGIVSSLLASVSLYTFLAGLRRAGLSGTAERVMASVTAGGVAVLTLITFDGMTNILLAGLLGYPS